MIEIYDDVCSFEDNVKFYNYFLKGHFEYGERDMPYHPPTGLISPIDEKSEIFIQMLRVLNRDLNTSMRLDNNSKDGSLHHNVRREVEDLLAGKEKQIRAYVNLFLPNERPFFHTDGSVITCLFYFTPHSNPDIDEGGETQFYVDKQLLGVLPRPSRLVLFDGNISHRATSFRSYPRITAAIKFRVV